MLWYGVESLAETRRSEALALLEECRIPLVEEHFARRLAGLPAPIKDGEVQGPSGLVELVRILNRKSDPGVRRSILRGARAALRGRRDLKVTREWSIAYEKQLQSSDAEVRMGAILLASLLGDRRAVVQLKEILMDSEARRDDRTSALEANDLVANLRVRQAEEVGMAHGVTSDLEARLL